jgi:2-methylcitrate dehydratase
MDTRLSRRQFTTTVGGAVLSLGIGTRARAAPRAPYAVEQLAAWVLAQRAEEMPEPVVNQAKLLVLDTIGCGFAAFEEEAAKGMLAGLKEMGGAAQCSVLGQAAKTSAPNAVLVNGSLIRILDLNDYSITKSGQVGGHPSDNIPVALAAAELAGSSGRDIIAAIVIGYEVMGRLTDLMQRDGAWDGVTISGFVAPAMAARLMKLDQTQLANALALSGARAVTSRAVRQGAISAAKSVANALVAQNGMQATVLARHGVTGPLDLFENESGLRPVFPGIGKDNALTAPFTAPSHIMGSHIKVFPCLFTGQAIVAAGIELHRQVGGDIGRLKRVRVAIADTPFLARQKDDPGRIDPKSREAADHSFNYLAAVALLDGDFGLDSFDNERWNDPKIRAVMQRLDLVCDGSLNSRSIGGFPCAMQGAGTDGKTYVAEMFDPPGFSQSGLDQGIVLHKFNSVTSHRLSRGARDRIIEAALTLDKASSPAKLIEAITA